MNIPLKIELGDLCGLITDGKHGDCRNEDGSGYYFVSCKDIKDERINYENAREITYDDFSETHRRTDLSPGDVVLTNSGTIGRLAIAKDDEKTSRTTFQKSVAVLKPKREKITSGFLYYSLKANHARLINGAGGAAQKNLLLGELRRFAIAVPNIGVQKSIVSVLSSYDNLIENNRRRIQLLEESARLLYQEWFVHLRFPGHEQVKINDGVPEGWEPTLVPDVIDVNPRTPVEKGKEIWYVPMSSLSETSMTANTADFERRTKHTNVKFKKNDVLLARITPCLENGKTGYAYFLAENEVACGSTEFIVLRGRRVPSEFVYCLARSYPFRENAIKSMTGSSGRQRVQNSCFDKYAVPLPPNSILDEFVEVVQNNFDQIRNLMAQNARLAKARDLLLPKLMSGELTV
ncbi:MAG: restriction endonuclease subunit S [Candidatus Thiodiazotropha weberae]|nr:restriction endonuclease subunit S [Candidatus Thiodiazotropha lotti]MCG8010624.1 restriction endonuclease subunit S [Candidatus Thiodiazotropha lotti]MCW4210084.1 restriction endonuclease subunit S [Candidatus Thiodiazotropha lotti]MCW4217531.1 restriction endonuclease subunit S [Candidatus Thiodiazotropha lotti]